MIYWLLLDGYILGIIEEHLKLTLLIDSSIQII
jgi:hypothetical protein